MLLLTFPCPFPCLLLDLVRALVPCHLRAHPLTKWHDRAVLSHVLRNVTTFPHHLPSVTSVLRQCEWYRPSSSSPLIVQMSFSVLKIASNDEAGHTCRT